MQAIGNIGFIKEKHRQSKLNIGRVYAEYMQNIGLVMYGSLTKTNFEAEQVMIPILVEVQALDFYISALAYSGL